MVFSFLLENGKTLQSDIEYYMSNFKIGVEPFSRQYVSKQRMFISPGYFKSINRKFLINIDYSTDNPNLKTYNGFFLIAGDGSDTKLPDFPEVREAFNVIKYSKIYKTMYG